MNHANPLTNRSGDGAGISGVIAHRTASGRTVASTSYHGAPPVELSGLRREDLVPVEVKGWNWGAFLACVPWGLGNRVWIVLLALIPWPVPGLMALVLAVAMGLKGSELAWRSKRWASVEDFRAAQRRWAIAGVVLNVVSIAVMVAWPNVFFGR